jgi:hypothetical protein
MAATIAAYQAALKRVQKGDVLVDQIFTDDELLKKIESTDKYTEGEVVRVPLHTSRSGAYSALPQGGGNLNDAGNQGIDKAEYHWANHHYQIGIQGDVADATMTNAQAVANAVKTEIKGATDDIRFHISRQCFQNGEGIVARCGTTTATNVVTLAPDASASAQYTNGNNALTRGWLYPGLPVDIGTASSEASLVDGEVITAVGTNVSDATRTITVSTSITTTTSNYVSVKNARSGATSNEGNGFRNMVDTGQDFGNLTVAGQPTWAAANEDNTAQALTISLLAQQDQFIHQRIGKKADFIVTGLKQERKFYELLQQQVRFNSDTSLGAGAQETPKWNGKDVIGHPNCHDEDLYMGIWSHIFIAAKAKPYWQNTITGGEPLAWIQGTDAYGAKLTYRINLCTDRRGAFSAMKGLT